MSEETTEPVTEFSINASGSGHTLTGGGKIPIYACSNVTRKIQGKSGPTIIDILPSGIESSKINLLLITSNKYSDECYKICYIPFDKSNNSQQQQSSSQQQSQQQQSSSTYQQHQQHQHQYVCCVCNKPHPKPEPTCECCGKPHPKPEPTCECCGKPHPKPEPTCECDYGHPTDSGGETNGSSKPPDEKPPEDCMDLLTDHLYSGSSMVKLLSKGKEFSKLKVWNQFKNEIELKVFCCFGL